MRGLIKFIIILCSVLLALVFYTYNYSLESIDDFEIAIEKKVKSDVTIIDTMRIDDELLIYFRIPETKHHGYISASEGFNEKYHLESGRELPQTKDLSLADYEINELHYLLFFGAKQPVESIMVNTYDGEKVLTIGDNDVFTSLVTKTHVLGVKFYYYTVNSERTTVTIDDTIDYMLYDGDINGGPRKLVTVVSLLIIVMGIVATFIVTPRINKLEQLYFKLTKTIPTDEDSEDKNDYMMLH